MANRLTGLRSIDPKERSKSVVATWIKPSPLFDFMLPVHARKLLAMLIRPFHFAFTVNDLDAAEQFYHQLLECPIGRRSESWIDFNLMGHQIVAHLDPTHQSSTAANPVDGDSVPVPHFGIILEPDTFDTFAAMLLKKPSIDWRIRPKTRFAGEVGEQKTMFFVDPAGNALEFKSFHNDSEIFRAD